MISFSGFGIRFGGRYLFADVTLTVNPSDKIGLIGRNGSGKSTFLKVVAGHEEASEGIITFPKDYTVGYLPQELSIEYSKNVFDEVYASVREIPELNAERAEIYHFLEKGGSGNEDEYSRVLARLGDIEDRLKVLGAESINSDIEQVLIGLGFSRDDFGRAVDELSGGWQMRVELAKILVNKPHTILLDEPTNHLDIESVSWLENFLKNYEKAVLLVSHDKVFLDNVTRRTFEITNGKIIDMDVNYSEYIVRRAEQKEIELKARRNTEKQIEQTERFIERFRSKATLASRVQSRVKALEKIELAEIDEDDITAMNIRFPEPPRSGRLVAETKNLHKYYGEKHVLKGVNFALERGEKVAFVGRNGEGKSTLSRILAGIESYDGVMTPGSSVTIGYYAQLQAQTLPPDSTPFEIIDRAATGDMRTKVRSLLGAFLFSGDDIYKKVKVLSGGEKSRLALAKLMLEPVNFLILDEPTNHLDMISKDVLKNALIDFGGSMVIVSHDRDFLEGLTTKTIYFKDGQIREFLGSINEFLSKAEFMNFSELEKKNNDKTQQQKESSASDAQRDRETRKELQREESRLAKQLKSFEDDIATHENKIAELEELFSDPEFFKNQATAQEKQQQYNALQSTLEKLYEEWESAQFRMDEIKTALQN